MTSPQLAGHLRAQYGAGIERQAASGLRGLVRLYVDDVWKHYCALAREPSVEPPYTYVVDSAFGRSQSMTFKGEESVVVDLRSFAHFKYLTDAARGEPSANLVEYGFNRLLAEKLYCAGRLRESTAFLMASNSRARAVVEATSSDRETDGGSAWWQFMFLIAHELCHTMLRVSASFRAEAAQSTQAVLASIDMNAGDKGGHGRSAVGHWMRRNVPRMSAAFRPDRAQARALTASVDAVEPSAGDSISDMLRRPSWIEEVTCDIQAGLFVMSRCPDRHVGLLAANRALHNLRTVAHFDVLARLPISNHLDNSDRLDPAGAEGRWGTVAQWKDVTESKYRRFVLMQLLVRSDAERFAEPQGKYRSWRRWMSEPGDGWTAAERSRGLVLNEDGNDWAANVLAPLLMVYPAHAHRLLAQAQAEIGAQMEALVRDAEQFKRSFGPGTFSA